MHHPFIPCFNRYMVECELDRFKLKRYCKLGFNRYMVECECSSTCFKYSFAFVLIDTWWNVNKLRDTPVLADRIVLIDTWWNVNYDVYEIEELATGFNRYMVECESDIE